MATHSKTVCPKGHLILQCRCPSPNKVKLTAPSTQCPTCIDTARKAQEKANG